MPVLPRVRYRMRSPWVVAGRAASVLRAAAAAVPLVFKRNPFPKLYGMAFRKGKPKEPLRFGYLARHLGCQDRSVEILSSRILLRPTDLGRSRRFYRDVLGL